MARYRVTIEYDGGPFVGWQAQHTGPSIQSAVEAALLKLGEAAPKVWGAGRTDAGVHALGQVAHFDIVREWKGGKLRDALNAHLRPQPIAVLDATPVPPGFHARFDAVGRHYLYRILDRRVRPALERTRVWWRPRPLEAGAMHEAAQRLVGRHDFTTFRSSECQAASPLKTLDRLDVAREGAEIHIRASARSFLHNQVRSMVGSLVRVGEGRWSADDLAQALAARDRAACGPVAPPHGLYLIGVDYP